MTPDEERLDDLLDRYSAARNHRAGVAAVERKVLEDAAERVRDTYHDHGGAPSAAIDAVLAPLQPSWEPTVGEAAMVRMDAPNYAGYPVHVLHIHKALAWCELRRGEGSALIFVSNLCDPEGDVR